MDIQDIDRQMCAYETDICRIFIPNSQLLLKILVE